METINSRFPSSLGAMAVVVLSQSDRLRFINFPAEESLRAEAVVTRSWPPGIQDIQALERGYEYKLRGTPWGNHGVLRYASVVPLSGEKEPTASRRLLLDVFAHLYCFGWVLTTPITTKHTMDAKDSLLFRWRDPSTLPRASWAVVQFSDHRVLHLTGDGEPLDNLADLIQTHLDIYEATYTKESLPGVGYEFRMAKDAWLTDKSATGYQGVHKLVVLTNLAMGLGGWESYGTVRLRIDLNNVQESDSWYIIKPST